MSELETLRNALAEELSYLWTDLQSARHDALNGSWSVGCEWFEGRIKAITPLVGPTPWEKLDIQLIEDGVYQRIHQELGIEAPYDEEGVRKHREQLDNTGQVHTPERPASSEEKTA